jgi:hypothetical protein
MLFKELVLPNSLCASGAMDQELVFNKYPGWDTLGKVWRARPEYVPPYSPPSMDAAENLKFSIWLANHPNVPVPYAHRVNSALTYLEEQVHDLPSNPIPIYEELEVPY